MKLFLFENNLSCSINQRITITNENLLQCKCLPNTICNNETNDILFFSVIGFFAFFLIILLILISFYNSIKDVNYLSNKKLI